MIKEFKKFIENKKMQVKGNAEIQMHKKRQAEIVMPPRPSKIYTVEKER